MRPTIMEAKALSFWKLKFRLYLQQEGFMSLQVRYTIIDCFDPSSQAKFWCDVLDAKIVGIGESILIEYSSGILGKSQIYLNQASSAIEARGKILWLRPEVETLENEVSRLLDLGATLTAKRHYGWGLGEVDMADPEGNRFVVSSSEAEESQLDWLMETQERDAQIPFWADAEVRPHEGESRPATAVFIHDTRGS
ncbi:hypothetical protein ABIA33_007492 [Streptacidiphilus sp. MAP12-16]|uniref:VOC family protein n=1 Tax=Streptacidiphilus sp. MAP12-16 TaxID=3156300 RepID=UPI00351350DE